MASLKSTSHVQVPLVHRFELENDMQLQVTVSGFASECNARVEFQLKNCSSTWILHWGCTYPGNKNWFIPSGHPSGTRKQMALQTPFLKDGEIYAIVIELRDPNIHAIEFVLKDSNHNKWLKLNEGNFHVNIPKSDTSTSHPLVPKDLIELKAYMLWESKGKPSSSLQQQKEDYDDAQRELQSMLSNGISLDELRSSLLASKDNFKFVSKELPDSQTPHSLHRRRNVGQWLQKQPKRHSKGNSYQLTALMDVVERSMEGDVIQRQSYQVGDYEIVVFLRVVRADYHLVVAGNTKGITILHWGVSKLSPRDWLAPPPDMLPEKSKLFDAACQTYLTDMQTGKEFFQFVDINLQQRKFVSIQFVIWTGGSWIKNNGANFFVPLNPLNLISGEVEHEGKGIVKWLLDDIAQREKEAERSLMHRFNIATELTERCQNEGQLGLIGILVWLRFMVCRQLAWNKNYNVKPREISEAQDGFINLLQRLYSSQPNGREIIRLIMRCVGRGGRGDAGQRIRDEILTIQRNNDCKSGMMEEWHQKLHNNSSPDDVVICEALINYLRCGFKIDVYWQTLTSNGLTKDVLASYDRPILSEPCFRTDVKERLAHDLTSYLKTLKAVHSGADLESSIEKCLGVSEGCESRGTGSADSVCGLSQKLQDDLRFITAHAGDKNIFSLVEKLLDSRCELHPLLLAYHGRLKDLLFLDLALESAIRITLERRLKDLNFTHLPDFMFFISVMLENLCLSTDNNEDLIYCTKDWYRIIESYKAHDGDWALQTKAVVDRIQLVLANISQYYQKMIQPSVQYLGSLLSLDKWTIDIFTEELIRAGSAATLSMLINRLDPTLRKLWQVISPVEVSGILVTVNELIAIQNKVYEKPTVIVANKVSGEEEIPAGAVAVLTSDMPDVLSHVSIRARNSKVLFAACFDQKSFRDLKLKEGKAVSIGLKATNLIITEISNSDVSPKPFSSRSTPSQVSFGKKAFSGKYAVSLDEFTSDMVGSKSCNIKFLRGKVPSWIKIPVSVALPYGVFESVLSESINKDLARQISCFCRILNGGDLSKLQAIQECVRKLQAPPCLSLELRSKMKSSRIPWPGDEGEERWNQAWQAIKKVWASKWNERAYISCRKSNMKHAHLCMAVLIQEIINADYAFVIHTRNPLSGDPSEIYTEVVKGLGETLVGAYPGRAMSFITRKGNLKSPIVVGYPSKQTGLYIRRSLIFRSDSNGEDLEGYAGAGLYDSVSMDKEEEVVLDYSSDPIIVDKAFQTSLFSRIAEAGKIIEGLYGCAQDIEGVVKDQEIYVVQSRPQI